MKFMCKYEIHCIKHYLRKIQKHNIKVFRIYSQFCPCRFEININRTEDTEHVIIPVCLREKFRHSSYTHHTGSSLFGQPFLMAVPRNNTEDKLYNLLLLRMW